jgi:hypothetical protein
MEYIRQAVSDSKITFALYLNTKKRKKDLVDCMLLGIYFFLSINAPTTAMAMIITTTPTAKYMIMSELETTGCVAEVGAAVGDAADATVAEDCAYELKYESVPANVA